MRRLIQLLDICRNKGVIVAVPGRHGGVVAKLEPLNDIEVKLFSQVQPFVFSDSEPYNANLSEEDKHKLLSEWKPGLDEVPDLDAPFPVFSIEYLNGAMDSFQNAQKETNKTLCILVIEVEPKVYGYYAMTELEGGGMCVWKSNAEAATVMHVLKRLAKEQMGTENVRHIVRLGTGSGKVMHRIRKVIHVTPKKQTIKYDGTRTVDWTHRWEVRGHWRKHEGLGKDRTGEYTVNGFTWVTHHEKGPEHLPLVNKTRLVD